MTGYRRIRVTPCPKAHPMVRELFRIMAEEECGVVELGSRAGVNPDCLKDWRTRSVPRIHMLEACFNALGYRLAVVSDDGVEAGYIGLANRAALVEEEDARLARYIEGIASAPLEFGLDPKQRQIYSLLDGSGLVSTALIIGACALPNDKALRVHVSLMRRKLKPFGIEIKNAPGFGYEMRRTAAPAMEVAA